MAAHRSTGTLQFEKHLEQAWTEACEGGVIDEDLVHGAGEALDLSSGSLANRSSSGHKFIGSKCESGRLGLRTDSSCESV